MLPLFAQFRGKPTWVVTGTTKLPANDKNIEVTTYSDGDVLFWAPDANVQIELKYSDVERLKKLLNNMKAPIPSTRLPEVIKGPASPFEVVAKSTVPAVKQYHMDDKPAPTMEAAVKQAEKYSDRVQFTTVEVQHHIDLPSDIISPSFKQPILTKSTKVIPVPPNMTLEEAKLVYATKDAPNADPKQVIEARKVLRKDALFPKTSVVAPVAPVVVKEAPKVVKEVSAKAPVKIERSVKKEDQGWGSNVNIGGKPVRYYYNYREPARNSAASHKVGGPEGRIA